MDRRKQSKMQRRIRRHAPICIYRLREPRCGVNGDKPYYFSVEFLRNLIKDDVSSYLPVFERYEEVLGTVHQRRKTKIIKMWKTMSISMKTYELEDGLLASDFVVCFFFFLT